jgi:hypothetical protein
MMRASKKLMIHHIERTNDPFFNILFSLCDKY